jgi:hypothetical protein
VSGKLYDNELSQFKKTIKRISHIKDIKGERKKPLVKWRIEWEKKKNIAQKRCNLKGESRNIEK